MPFVAPQPKPKASLSHKALSPKPYINRKPMER